MKISTYRVLLGLAIALLGITFGGCTKEDESDCFETLELAFNFNKKGTECFDSEVSSLAVFVFDEQGVFVGRWDENDNSKFTSDYTMRLPLPAGEYSCIAWGGLGGQHFNVGCGTTRALTSPVVGQTTMNDLLLRLKCQTATLYGEEKEVLDYQPASLFYGSVRNIELVAGAGQKKAGISLQKNSTQIRLTLIGLPLPTRNPFTQLDLYFESSNGGYAFDNSIDNNNSCITHLAQGTTVDANNRMYTNLYTHRMLKSDPHRLMIRDNRDNSTYFEADLMKDYILKNPQYTTQAAIDQEDLFDIVLEFDPYVGVSVTVNGWDVTGNEIIIQ